MPAVKSLAVLTVLLGSGAFAQQNLTLCPEALRESSYAPSDTWAMLAHQGQNGWLFGRGDFSEGVSSLGYSKAAMQALQDAFKREGIQLVMVDVPSRLVLSQKHLDASNLQRYFSADNIRYNYADLHDQFTELGIIAPNLMEDGLQFEASKGPYFQATDHHWTTAATKHVAELIAAEIKKLPSYSTFKKTEYTLESKVLSNNGSYARMANNICKTQFPDEMITSYTAVPKSSGDLFAEEDPDVVLVGTSFSHRREYTTDDTLPEVLKYELQTDVLNGAVEGGGSFGGMEAYLMSDSYKQHKPKVIVWENNFYMGELGNLWAMSRMVALARGGCSNEVLWQGTGTLSRNLRIELPENVQVTTDSAIKIKFSDLKITDFQMNLEFSVGSQNTQHSRTWRIPNNGEFQMQLPRPGTLEALQLNLYRGDVSGTYQVTVCKMK